MAVMISMQVKQFAQQQAKDFAELYEIWRKIPDLPESELEYDIELQF